MDEEVMALLNSKVGEDDNDLGGAENRGDAGDIDECRSISVVGKSDSSSSLSGSDDVSSSVVDDDSGDEYSKTCIRVGDAYQVFIPEKPPTKYKDDPREGVLVWTANESISIDQLSEYIQYACDTQHYTIEQALGVLLWHNHNVDTARVDLPNFESGSETWSADDVSLFEEAYKIHNKRFHSYAELLPHKSMASLVDYYYSRHKRRSSSYTPMNLRSSHVGAFSATAPGVAAAAPKAEANIEKATSNAKSTKNLIGTKPCQSGILSDPRIKVLPSLINPTNPQPPPPSTAAANGKSKAPFARPPRGLYLRLEDLAALASLAASSRSVNPPTDPLDGPRSELASSLTRLQQQRQRCSEYKKQLAGGIQPFRALQLTPAVVPGPMGQSSSPPVEPQWTKHETSLAVAAFRQYGANFSLIAEFIGTKSEAHVRYFYQTYRNRYNLDSLLAEYEAERRNLNLFPSIEEDYLKRKNIAMAQRSIGNGVAGNNGTYQRSEEATDFLTPMPHPQQQPQQQQSQNRQQQHLFSGSQTTVA